MYVNFLDIYIDARCLAVPVSKGIRVIKASGVAIQRDKVDLIRQRQHRGLQDSEITRENART